MGDVGRCPLRGNRALVEECVAFCETHFPDRYFELIRTVADRMKRPISMLRLNWLRHVVCRLLRQNDVRFLKAMILTPMRFVSRSTTVSPSTILNVHAIIQRSSICAVKKKCASCSPIFRRRWKMAEIAKRCNVTVRLRIFPPQFPDRR